VETERRILIVDTEEGELQELALRLIGCDFDVQYANDIDEAQMIAREAAGRIHAVLLCTRLKLERISDVARRFRVDPAALVSIGPRPPENVVAALAHHGVRWHLWDDPADESIRFVLSNILFEQDPLEIRFNRRVPLNHPAELQVEGAKGATAIRDISLGGACLLGGVVGDEGDRGTLRFSQSDDDIELPIRIAWAAGEVDNDLRVAGVTFLEVSVPAGEVIDALMESVLARHRIR
jgi:hypothetical protein